MIDLCFVVWTE